MALRLTADLTKLQVSYSPNNINTNFGNPKSLPSNSNIKLPIINLNQGITNVSRIIEPENKSIIYAKNQTYPLQQLNIPTTINGLAASNGLLSPIPGIGGANLAGIATSAIGIVSPAASQAVSAANYIANLPLSLYKRPDGIFLITSILGEIAFNHYFSRYPTKFGDNDFLYKHGVEEFRYNHSSTIGTQVVNLGYAEGQPVGHGISTEVPRSIAYTVARSDNQTPLSISDEYWKHKNVYYVDKFSFILGKQLVRNINYDLYKLYGTEQLTLTGPGNISNTNIHKYLPSDRFNLSDGAVIEAGNYIDFINGKYVPISNPPPGSNPYISDTTYKDPKQLHTNIGNNNTVNNSYKYATSTYDQLQKRADKQISNQESEYSEYGGGFQDFRLDLPSNDIVQKPLGSNAKKKVDFSKYIKNTGGSQDDLSDPLVDAAVIDPILFDTNIHNNNDVDDYVVLRFDGFQFRSYLTDFNDSFSHNYQDVLYVGRPNPLKLYNSSVRNISIGFIVPALTRYELKSVYSKLTGLTKLTLPSGIGIYDSPIVVFKLGNYIEDQVVINTLQYTIDTEYPWEINLEKSNDVGEVPHIIKVTVDMSVVGNTIMSSDRYKVFNL